MNARTHTPRHDCHSSHLPLYPNPSTSDIVYRPGFCRTSHSAARQRRGTEDIAVRRDVRQFEPLAQHDQEDCVPANLVAEARECIGGRLTAHSLDLIRQRIGRASMEHPS